MSPSSPDENARRFNAEVSENPYEPKRDNDAGEARTHPILWLALLGIFAKMTALGFFFFPAHAIAIGYDFLAIAYVVASSAGVKLLGRRKLRRPNAVSMVVILAIGLILHGLALPAIQT